MQTRKPSQLLLVLFLISVISCAQYQADSTQQNSEQLSANDMAIPGEIIVQFHPGTSEHRIREILNEIPVTVKKQLGSPFVYLVQPLGGRTMQEGISRLQQYREVQYAEPNRVHRMFEPSQRLPSGKQK